jgi:hypothetical protein
MEEISLLEQRALDQAEQADKDADFAEKNGKHSLVPLLREDAQRHRDNAQRIHNRNNR